MGDGGVREEGWKSYTRTWSGGGRVNLFAGVSVCKGRVGQGVG